MANDESIIERERWSLAREYERFTSGIRRLLFNKENLGKEIADIPEEERIVKLEIPLGRKHVAVVVGSTDYGGPKSKYGLDTRHNGENQDSLFVGTYETDEGNHVMTGGVVDAAGGHGGEGVGVKISTVVNREISQCLQNKTTMEQAFANADKKATQDVPDGKACAVAVRIAVDHKTGEIEMTEGWWGDSSIHVARGGKLLTEARSETQNLATALVKATNGTQVAYFKDFASNKNIIFGWLGIKKNSDKLNDTGSSQESQAGFHSMKMQVGDVVILASDSLGDVVSDYEIEKICQENKGAEAIQNALLSLIRERIVADSYIIKTSELEAEDVSINKEPGKKEGDNTTVLVIEIKKAEHDTDPYVSVLPVGLESDDTGDDDSVAREGIAETNWEKYVRDRLIEAGAVVGVVLDGQVREILKSAIYENLSREIQKNLLDVAIRVRQIGTNDPVDFEPQQIEPQAVDSKLPAQKRESLWRRVGKWIGGATVGVGLALGISSQFSKTDKQAPTPPPDDQGSGAETQHEVSIDVTSHVRPAEIDVGILEVTTEKDAGESFSEERTFSQTAEKGDGFYRLVRHLFEKIKRTDEKLFNKIFDQAKKDYGIDGDSDRLLTELILELGKKNGVHLLKGGGYTTEVGVRDDRWKSTTFTLKVEETGKVRLEITGADKVSVAKGPTRTAKDAGDFTQPAPFEGNGTKRLTTADLPPITVGAVPSLPKKEMGVSFNPVGKISTTGSDELSRTMDSGSGRALMVQSLEPPSATTKDDLDTDVDTLTPEEKRARRRVIALVAKRKRGRHKLEARQANMKAGVRGKFEVGNRSFHDGQRVMYTSAPKKGEPTTLEYHVVGQSESDPPGLILALHGKDKDGNNTIFRQFAISEATALDPKRLKT